MEIKKGHGLTVSLWQREKDSNPHIRSQSPLCYLYTIPLCPDEQKLLYRFHGVCQQFFQKNRNLSASRNLTGYSGGGSVWSAAAKKENASGKTGGFRIIWRFGCFGRWHTRRTGRGREAAAAMRILYICVWAVPFRGVCDKHCLSQTLYYLR